jgi:hydroxymethylpyrimidine pyrophosphatase-like HAD family hydrolase
MFEELLISVLFIIVLIILCIISNLYSKKKEEKEKYIMLMNSIKEDLKENFISEEEYWQYNKEYSDKIKKIKEDIQLYEEEKEKEKETIKNNDTDWMNIFKKKEKINELNRLLIDELIEDIVVSEDGNIKVIFKYEDKYFEALDFINKQKYDIILPS